MPQQVTLQGAEQVERAASTMRAAAQQMAQAAESIVTALAKHEARLDEWLFRLEHVLAERGDG